MADSKTLTDSDIADAAAALGTDRATVLALLEVEAAGDGFLPDGRPKLRFEAHHFSRLTEGRFDADYPEVSAPTWDRNLYADDGAGEHDRLKRAMALNATAALKAASWGMPQLMGFNHDLCGFDRVDAFADEMRQSERRQLMAMVRFIQARGLEVPLQARAWREFAEGYNGPAYERHGYHTRLADAYTACLREMGADRPVLRKGKRGPEVTRVQRALNRARADGPRDDDELREDGIFGPETSLAVKAFQEAAELRVDGVVGPRTWGALDQRGLLGDATAAAA